MRSFDNADCGRQCLPASSLREIETDWRAKANNPCCGPLGRQNFGVLRVFPGGELHFPWPCLFYTIVKLPLRDESWQRPFAGFAAGENEPGQTDWPGVNVKLELRRRWLPPVGGGRLLSRRFASPRIDASGRRSHLMTFHVRKCHNGCPLLRPSRSSVRVWTSLLNLPSLLEVAVPAAFNDLANPTLACFVLCDRRDAHCSSLSRSDSSSDCPRGSFVTPERRCSTLRHDLQASFRLRSLFA